MINFEKHSFCNFLAKRYLGVFFFKPKFVKAFVYTLQSTFIARSLFMNLAVLIIGKPHKGCRSPTEMG